MEEFISLVVATSLLLGSPGPAPLALAATGATIGTKQGLPFLSGILLGLLVVITTTTLGLTALFTAFPALKLTMQVVGGLYIIYVAVKIARVPILSPQQANINVEKMPGLIDGFILNLLNPKAYAALLALFSQFTLPLASPQLGLIATATTCFILATILDFIWLAMGSVLRPLFEKPTSAKIVRSSFATLMIAAVAFTFVEMV
ncbi:LysE family translocator [Paraneptunicella aestuarii]|uniref:LysE family translocator n=1 Tax=Paraneptunicella aestuarii TaxID=2831148 RepID=UPI001E391634|nr:LysE family translocator [Paraneptunicella aestuarii]UAA40233.1 LysE family translocator [Paraneptunicella aestuarii]